MEKFVLLISTVKLEKSLRLIQLINTKSLKFFLRIFRVRSTTVYLKVLRNILGFSRFYFYDLKIPDQNILKFYAATLR